MCLYVSLFNIYLIEKMPIRLNMLYREDTGAVLIERMNSSPKLENPFFAHTYTSNVRNFPLSNKHL